MKQLLKEGKIISAVISKRLGLSVAAVAAVTGTFDKEVPLENCERHCLSLQESPFGNEATKDSLHQRGSPLRRGHFNEQLPLYFPCGPIHCCGRRRLGGRGRLIWNVSIDYLKYVLTGPGLCANSQLRRPQSCISADGGGPEWCWHCKMAGSASCSKTGITY